MHWSKAGLYRKMILDHLASKQYDFITNIAKVLKINIKTIQRHSVRLLFEGKIITRYGVMFLVGNKYIIDDVYVYKKLDISLSSWKRLKRCGIMKGVDGRSVILISNVIDGLNKIRVGTPVYEIPECIQQIEVMRLLGKQRNDLNLWMENGLPYFIHNGIILFSKSELSLFLNEYISKKHTNFHAKNSISRLQKALDGLNMPKL